MASLFSLVEKNVLITGASSGIGKAAAIVSSQNGANLIVQARNKDRLDRCIIALDNAKTNIPILGDLTLEEDLDKIVIECPSLDGLVLNAGIVKLSPVQFIKKSDLDLLFDTNVKSSILLVQKLLKAKKINKFASIVFVSSIASQKVTLGNAMYAASKGAVNSFTKALALELSPKKIRVNAILPGLVETDILGENSNKEELSKHLNNYPLGRFGQPNDIAYLIQYLLSNESSWMTGNLIPIDGGFSLK
jgi:NAD(P)-dependent dehydrogenase (short-subunit alcohol dehydrogenase family)